MVVVAHTAGNLDGAGPCSAQGATDQDEREWQEPGRSPHDGSGEPNERQRGHSQRKPTPEQRRIEGDTGALR